ncbi:MAG: SMI1/KNR4 family protein [Burkholderiales bacterium]|nr:SMI1/KNR4 family protein [Burkholderiales bacterium]
MNALPPGSLDPAAQRVAAEKAQLAALVTEPEMEIVGVTSMMGAGAMGSPATDEWSLRLSLLRWREAGGDRGGGELMIRLVTNEVEIDRLVDAIPGPTAVRMRVRMIAQPAVPDSPLDAFAAAILVALMNEPVDDAEMNAFAAQLQAEEEAGAAPGTIAEERDVPPMTMESLIAAVKKKLPPAPEAEVAAFEASLGCRLPADYRAFLIACNGGFLSGTLGFAGLSPTGEPVSVSIHHIDGFREENHLSITFSRELFEGRIPDDLLMIMDDPSGNAICLGLRGPYTGKVYLWDHEEEPDDDWDGAVESAGNIQLLADSFSAFVAGLRPTGL